MCLSNYKTGKVLRKLGTHKDSVECVRFKRDVGSAQFASSNSLDGIHTHIRLIRITHTPAPPT